MSLQATGQVTELFYAMNTAGSSAMVRNLGNFMFAIRNIDTMGLGSVFKEGKTFFSSVISAHPVITSIAALAAIGWGLDKFVFTMDDKFENAQEAIQNYQSTQQEIEGVNNELATTQSRMNELLAKDSLTLVEKDEITKLQQSNDELERRQKILADEEQANRAKATDEANRYFTDKSIFDDDFKLLNPSTWGDSILDKDAGLLSRLTILDAAEQRIERIKENRNQIADWEADDVKKWEKSIDATNRVIETDTAWLTDHISTWNELTTGIEDDIDSGVMSRILSITSDFDTLLGNKGTSTTAKIEGAVAKYKDLRENLIDLANAGQLTGENLKSAGGDFSAFYDDMVRKGVSIDDVISHFQSIADPSGYNFDVLRKQMKEQISKIGDDVNTFADSFVDSLSNEELEVYAQIRAEDIDTSEWDTGIWKEQIRQRLEGETIEVDINATPRLDKFREAVKKESEAEEKGNSDNYKFIQSNLEDIINMRKDGLVGTDIFRSFTSFISPNGIDTLKEYDKAIGKIKRYFTEDNKGVGNFITDLKSLGMLTQSGNQLSLQVDDVGQAAKDMGVSVETFVAVCQRLNDYGIFTGIYNNAEEAKEEIQNFYDEYSKLEAERDALNYAINDTKNPLSADDKSAALDKVNALNGKINELKGNIDAAMESYLGLLAGGDSGDTIEDIANNADAAIGTAQRMAFKAVEEFNNLDWSKYENVGATQQKVVENLAALAKEASGKFALVEGKLTFTADAVSASAAGIEGAQEAQASANANPVKIKAIVGPVETKNTNIVQQVVHNAQQSASNTVNTVETKTTKVVADTSAFDTAVNQVKAKATEISNLNINPKISASDSATPTINSVSASLTNLDGKKATTYINVVKTESSSGGVQLNGNAHRSYGNANRNGNARAGGNWGEVRDVTALAGEIGSELVVRGNNWFTIDYPQFFKFKKGDIIFNADQTKAILEGRHTSFGRSLAQGNTGEARAAASGYGENPVLAGLITNPKAAKATEKAAKAVEKASKETSKKSKAQTNNSIYNWWQAYLDGASKTLNNFKSELDKLNSQYEDAIAHGWDESAKFIEERLKKSKEKYDKNFMDTLNELKADEQENLNALANIRPEFKGKSALDVINDETLEMQMTKDYEDRLAATTDETAKEKLQKEFDTYKSYLSSLENIRNEISSMEGNIRYVSDEYKLKVIGNAINLFNNGDASQVEEWAAKYGYESAEAFVDAWNRQDPDLMDWFKKAEVLDDGVLERRIAALQHTVDGNDFSLDVLADDSSNNGKRIELLKQQQALYHEMANEYRAFNYDEDSDEIQELQRKWRDSAKEIYEIEKETAEERREGIQSQIDNYDWLIDQAGDEAEETRHKYTLKALGDEVNLYNDIGERIKKCNQDLKNGAINVDEINKELAELREGQKDAISKMIEYMHALYGVEYEKLDDKIEDIKDDNDAIVDSIEDQIDALEKERKVLEKNADKYKQAAEAVKNCLINEKEMLEQEKEQKSEYWDARLEALEKANDEQTKAYDLTKKQQALEKAQGQKNTLMYVDNELVYQSNFEDVRQAAQDLQEEKRQQQHEKRKALLEDERDAEIQAIEDRMKSLDDYEDLWSEVFDYKDDLQNEEMAAELIGSNWRKKILALDKATYEDFRDAYYDIESQIEDYIESEIDRLNDSKDAAQEACDKQVKALEKSKKALEEQEKAVDNFAAKFAEAFITGDNSALNSFLKFVEGIAVGSSEVIGNIKEIAGAMGSATDSSNSSSGNTSITGGTYTVAIVEPDVSTNKSGGTTTTTKNKDGSTTTTTRNAQGQVTKSTVTLGSRRYASGTNNAMAGLSLVGERGAELVNFKGGEQVLNGRDTAKFIDEMSAISNSDIMDIASRVPSLNQLMGNMTVGEMMPNVSTDNSVCIGDINVEYSGADLNGLIDQINRQLPNKARQIGSRR